MMLEPREPAAPESYPTFWDELPRNPATHPLPVEDAYSAFVNLTEEDLQCEVLPDNE
jgi:hypothetical protein